MASYAGLVAVRVPQGRSSVTGSSACDSCGHRLRPQHNVPVVSWLALRGRCRDCGARIGVRHLIVELVGAAAFVLIGVVAPPSFGWPVACTAMVLTVGGLALSLIDIDTRTLPDRVLLPWSAVLVVTMVAGAIVAGDLGSLARAGLGGCALFALYFLVAVIYPAGMGFGDVKLAAPLGAVMAFASWPVLAVGAFCAFLLGGLGALVLALRGRLHRGTEVPFGPYMVAGAFVGLLVGDPVAHWYLTVFGLA
ncbi:prepilin peptidase [Cellulomonas hominis]|nr:A24 family peptidase [Cellulomonas hominis]NKY05933.1 prepilin peptidase [Cellulomonas hominis]